MSRRRMPVRAARNAIPESPRGSRSQPRRETTHTHARFSYAEDTDSSGGPDFTGNEDERIEDDGTASDPSVSRSGHASVTGTPSTSTQVRARSRAKPTPTRTTRARASAAAEAKSRAPKRRKTQHAVGRPRRANTKPSETRPQMHYPPWPAGLPYEVLLSIFQYAAYPLWDEEFLPNPSRKWLVDVALLRREFAEPALSALYYAPPLYPPTNAQRMIDRLRDQNVSIDYRAKIRYFDIYVPGTLLRKYDGSAPISMLDLINVAPQLRGIAFHFLEDNPRLKSKPEGRVDISKLASIYSTEVFHALDRTECPLRSWKWNIFPKPTLDMPWRSLPLIHSRPSFQRLTSLEISHARASSAGKVSAWQEISEALSTGIGMLPSLEALTLSHWEMLDTLELFSSMRPLKKLAFIGCLMLDSDFLAEFLKIHGQSLEELTLNHNADLNLEFTTDLGDYCPVLQSIEIDMTFYSSLLITSVQTPLFETLLSSRCAPTWPRTLRRISMLQLRKWDAEMAEPFFASLEDAAATSSLPDLRELIIKASLEGDWRDRIKFRDKWVDRLPGIFLRRSETPKRHFKREYEKIAASTPQAKEREETRSKLRRRGSHASEQLEDGMHGACSVVDIRIDNLRPMEFQYDESNFMDDEPSGDEDWDGDDGGNDDRYAW